MRGQPNFLHLCEADGVNDGQCAPSVTNVDEARFAINSNVVGVLSEIQLTHWLKIGTAEGPDCAITPARYESSIGRRNVAHALGAIQPRNPPHESAAAQIYNTHT